MITRHICNNMFWLSVWEFLRTCLFEDPAPPPPSRIPGSAPVVIETMDPISPYFIHDFLAIVDNNHTVHTAPFSRYNPLKICMTLVWPFKATPCPKEKWQMKSSYIAFCTYIHPRKYAVTFQYCTRSTGKMKANERGQMKAHIIIWLPFQDAISCHPFTHMNRPTSVFITINRNILG